MSPVAGSYSAVTVDAAGSGGASGLRPSAARTRSSMAVAAFGSKGRPIAVKVVPVEIFVAIIPFAAVAVIAAWSAIHTHRLAHPKLDKLDAAGSADDPGHRV